MHMNPGFDLRGYSAKNSMGVLTRALTRAGTYLTVPLIYGFDKPMLDHPETATGMNLLMNLVWTHALLPQLSQQFRMDRTHWAQPSQIDGPASKLGYSMSTYALRGMGANMDLSTDGSGLSLEPKPVSVDWAHYREGNVPEGTHSTVSVDWAERWKDIKKWAKAVSGNPTPKIEPIAGSDTLTYAEPSGTPVRVSAPDNQREDGKTWNLAVQSGTPLVLTATKDFMVDGKRYTFVNHQGDYLRRSTAPLPPTLNAEEAEPLTPEQHAALLNQIKQIGEANKEGKLQDPKVKNRVLGFMQQVAGFCTAAADDALWSSVYSGLNV